MPVLYTFAASQLLRGAALSPKTRASVILGASGSQSRRLPGQGPTRPRVPGESNARAAHKPCQLTKNSLSSQNAPCLPPSNVLCLLLSQESHPFPWAPSPAPLPEQSWPHPSPCPLVAHPSARDLGYRSAPPDHQPRVNSTPRPWHGVPSTAAGGDI